MRGSYAQPRRPLINLPAMEGKLSVSETLGDISGAYRAHAKQLVPLGFWFVLGPLFLQALGGGGVGMTLLVGVVQATIAMLYQGVVVELIRRRHEGDDAPGSAELVRSILPIALPLVIAGAIYGAGTTIGIFLLVVPGVILATIWAVVAPAIVVERTDVIGSFRRSRQLVKGNGWPVFGVVLVVGLLVALSSVLLYGIVTAAIGGTLLPVVLSAIAAAVIVPLEGLSAAALYYRLLEIQASRPSGVSSATAAGSGSTTTSDVTYSG